jgi:hypothetical protein
MSGEETRFLAAWPRNAGVFSRRAMICPRRAAFGAYSKIYGLNRALPKVSTYLVGLCRAL